MSHQNKDIRKAIEYAKSKDWTYVLAGGKSHIKGRLKCPVSDPDCALAIYGTPRNPNNIAKMIRREVDKCPHH